MEFPAAGVAAKAVLRFRAGKNCRTKEVESKTTKTSKACKTSNLQGALQRLQRALRH
jgi:hypothetical protein